MRIPDTIIESIRERADIVQVVGRHVPLKRAGRNHVGLCPFHNEKSPSFNVSPDRKAWHCFGCGEGGDVFKFLVRITHKPFPEVVKELGREVGVEVQEREETPEEREAERLRTRLHAILDLANEVYMRELQAESSADARAYVAGRGFDAGAVAQFEIGYGGAGWDLLWQRLGGGDAEKQQDLVKSGLCVMGERGPYDRFAGRIVFPIRDERLRVIGFGGRVFGERAKRDGVAKYVNTAESAVYDKSSVLYRLPQALQKTRRGAPVVVVEGYFDAIALERCGLATVATCGTALTPRHGQLLQKAAQRVVLCWDGDAAGERAVKRAAEVLLPLHVDTRVAVLPPGDDPDTYVARVGVPGAERLVQEAEPLPTFVIGQAARAAEDAGDDVPARAAAIRGLKWLFAAIPSALERDMYLKQAAEKLSLSPADLAHELAIGTQQATRRQEGASQKTQVLQAPHRAVAPAATDPKWEWVLNLYRDLFAYPQLAHDLDALRLTTPLSGDPHVGGSLLEAAGYGETAKLVKAILEQLSATGTFNLDEVPLTEASSRQLRHKDVRRVWEELMRSPPEDRNSPPPDKLQGIVRDWGNQLTARFLEKRRAQLLAEIERAEAARDTTAVESVRAAFTEVAKLQKSHNDALRQERARR